MQEYLEQLIRIYNTLLLISTKGEDTVLMGQCLGAFREVLTKLQSQKIDTASEASLN